MMERAKASGFDLSQLPAALRGERVVVEQPQARLPDASRFEEGQIAGPFGPQFVGFGPMPLPPLWSAFVNAALLAVMAGAVIVAEGRF